MNALDYLDTARKIVDAALALVPDDQVTMFLGEAAIRRANLMADAAEAAKFGSIGEPEHDGP